MFANNRKFVNTSHPDNRLSKIKTGRIDREGVPDRCASRPLRATPPKACPSRVRKTSFGAYTKYNRKHSAIFVMVKRSYIGLNYDVCFDGHFRYPDIRMKSTYTGFKNWDGI